MLLGSGFSPAFADVIFVIDAVVILIALLTVFFHRIAATCSAVRHRASAMVMCLIAHIGVRHR
ncbi:MAG TPA: hypothetical protein VFC14_22900 [Burkholderiales bacterium]|jgi:hypothetical protein|nr:hypothetical protein [Burkholderiales bacterium]